MSENKSLKSNIDSVDKIGEIKLAMKSTTGSRIIWMLVEGESDCKLFGKFVNGDTARVEYIQGGISALESALSELLEKTTKVLGVRDADFMHLENKSVSSKHLFLTDYHDLEMTMLSFEDVRNNLASEYQVDDFKMLWSNILEEAAYVGYLRWYNHKKGGIASFKGLGLGDITEYALNKLTIDKDKLVDKLNERIIKGYSSITLDTVKEFIDGNETRDLLNLCNGHDVAALIALAASAQVSAKELHRHLRLSFTEKEFIETDLYKNLLGWQTDTGYSIFPVSKS